MIKFIIYVIMLRSISPTLFHISVRKVQFLLALPYAYKKEWV